MSEPVVIVDYNPDWPALYEKEKGGSLMERDGRPQGPNTFQIRRRDVVVGTDGQPRGPHLHVHILPCPYDTPPWRADSPYSRGTLSGGQVKRGEDAGGGPLWSPVRCLHPSPSLKGIAPCGCPSCFLRERTPSQGVSRKTYP